VAASDDTWDRKVRGETETERLDRNWSMLVQELRVVQTGVQFLIGSLLILPFQVGFGTLSQPLRLLYLATVAAAICATVFLVAPVSWHRILFRRHRLGNVVAAAHRCAMAGIALLGVALTGAVVLAVATVTGTIEGVVAGVLVGALFVAAWVLAPWRWRAASRPADFPAPSFERDRTGT
jgi:O-antigen/teichoic acid export membrane protein